MCAAVSLKEFIVERLTAAAADIFSACEQTIVRYEEEIDRQRRLLEISGAADIVQNEAQTKTICCVHGGNQSEPELTDLKQEEAEPTQTKDEHRDLNIDQIKGDQCLGQTEQGRLDRDNDTFIIALTNEKKDLEEPVVHNENLHCPNSGRDESHEKNRTKDAASQSGVEDEKKENNLNQRFKDQENSNPTLTGSDNEGESSNGVADLKSDKCGKSLRKVRLKRQQKDEQTGRSQRCCPPCEKRPNEKKNIKGVHHGNPRVCEICGKTFSTQTYARIHMKSHAGEKPFHCNTCGKAFALLHHLTQHQVTHSSVKPFSCKTCGRQFRNYGHLFCHMRIHTGEKPYSCNTCGKNFSRQCSLKRHQRTHTRERPYVCNICGKAYMQPSHLSQHRFTHTGRKRFSCATCAKAYFYQGDLLRHVKKTH